MVDNSAALNTYVYEKKTEIEKIMIENVLNIEEITTLRKNIHQNAEIGFKEVETTRKLIEKMISYGLQESDMRRVAGTGIVVDITGKGEPDTSGVGINTIALRADMDALPIPENNPHLEYRTQTPFAHMCGHDGHMCSLLSAVQVICGRRDRIPSNKTIRLLW